MNRVTRAKLLLAAALPAVAIAAEEHAAHTAPSLGSLVLPILNFATFAGLFWYFAWPLIVGALSERRRLVEKEIAEADEVRRTAAAMLADIEARRAGLNETADRLVREIRAEAEREREHLLEAARRGAERIRDDARLLAEQEGNRAARLIREEVAARVIAEVVAKLQEQLTRDDEERFSREFVAAVESGEMR
ncbi:MAG: ATP synthase F0 subunit B [Candidatus Binatia bacterium]|jgi:F-type H+-transporting ATPase subunit b